MHKWLVSILVIISYVVVPRGIVKQKSEHGSPNPCTSRKSILERVCNFLAKPVKTDFISIGME